MTRVNCIPVSELTARHLVAEYRELPRLYALAAGAYARGETPLDHPTEYRLGAGHVRFFYSRIGFVIKRHRQLIAEMKRRGYSPSYDVVVAPELPQSWMRNWRPTAQAQAINRARIAERLRGER